MSTDYFRQAADSYEEDKNRVANIDNIAKAILNYFDFCNFKHIVDFGSGSGLLLERIAPHVDKITAVDISSSMNEVLEEKRGAIQCDLEILPVDLTKEKIERSFDGIISSMTIHHIEDVQSIFNEFYNLLNDNGLIAIADLELEDGNFHTDDTGVYHPGFDKEIFLNYAKIAGFKSLLCKSVSVSHKPQGDYPIFLLTGLK